MHAMECPNCNRPVEQTAFGDGEFAYHCPHCGWGTRTDTTPTGPVIAQDEEPDHMGLGKLAVFWVFTLVIAIGPYLALRFGVPVWVDTNASFLDMAVEKWVALVDLYYWLVFALYVAISGVLTPTWDPNNLGWGGGMFDDPFSLEDDWNRTMRVLAFLLIPGRTVWITLRETGLVLTGLFRR